MTQVVYRGNADGTESAALEHEGVTLRLNEPTDVSDEVLEHLTSGENADLFKIDVDGSSEKLTGQALKDRAEELAIEGRSDMKADELRDAIAAAEADQQGADG